MRWPGEEDRPDRKEAERLIHTDNRHRHTGIATEGWDSLRHASSCASSILIFVFSFWSIRSSSLRRGGFGGFTAKKKEEEEEEGKKKKKKKKKKKEEEGRRRKKKEGEGRRRNKKE